MKRAAAAMVAAFLTGGGVMALLSSMLGPLAEPLVLGLVGAGLYASSAILQGRLTAPPSGVAEEA